jgi:hypothetical protein
LPAASNSHAGLQAAGGDLGSYVQALDALFAGERPASATKGRAAANYRDALFAEWGRRG